MENLKQVQCKAAHIEWRLFMLLMMLALSALSPKYGHCENVKVGNLYYTVNSTSRTAVVTYASFQNYSNYSGLTSVHIPSSIEVNGVSYSVTAIGEYAFYRAKDLAYVSMDVGISEIGTFAFNECYSLVSIIFPDGLKTIGSYAFCRCSDLQEVILPQGLTSIQSRAFQECTRLRSVDFPASVKNIWSEVFYKASVKNIYLHDLSAWCNVSTFSSIFIDATNIYLNGEKIDRLVIPEGVTSIRSSVFSSLKCIKSLSLPSSLKSIGEYAFGFCEFTDLYLNNLESWCNVKIESGNFTKLDRLYVNGELVTDLTLPSGVTKINDYVFRGIESIESVQFPETLTSIGTSGFSGCANLKSITLPNSVETIEEGAFSQCSSLSGLYFKDGETAISIGISSFTGCPVKKIYIGRNASENAFKSLTSVQDVEIGEYVNNCMSLKWIEYSELQNIVSKAVAPPKSQAFLKSQYKNVSVLIPDSSRNLYETDPVWGAFWSVFPKSIKLDPSNVTVAVGENLKLSVIISPDNITNSSLTWLSSDDSIVEVDENGVITGIKEGNAKVTATTINGLTADCKIEVKTVPDSIIFNVTDSIELNIGEPFILSATVLPEGCSGSELTWVSDNEDIVSVVDGRLFPHQHGSTYVSASTSNGVSAHCRVDVSEENFCIELLPDTVELYYRQEKTIDLKVCAKHLSKEDIVLNIESSGIADLMNDSTIKARDLGTTLLTASYADEVYSKCLITVLPFKLSIDNEPHYVFPYADFYLDKIKVSILPEDMEEQLDIQWSVSTQPGISMRTGNTIMCWSPTTVKYKAYVEYGDYVFSSNVGTLICTNVKISTPDSVSTVCGKAETLNATVDVKGNPSMYHTSTEWISSDKSIIEITKSRLNSCEYISHKAGVAIITATVNGGAKSSTVITVEEAVPIASIGLTPAEWEGMPGDEFTIKASIYPENATNKTVVWKSSDSRIAEVNSYGHVKALHTGEAIITAESTDGSGVIGECPVIVKPILVDSIELSYESWTGYVGDAFRINETVFPMNAYNRNIIWSSSDEAIAQVNQAGVVWTLTPGEADIIATAADGSGISAKCHVTVLSALVESITLTPDSWSCEEGETFAISATVLPEYATNKSLVWSSNDRSVATVDSEGIVTVLKEGNCVIKATAADGSGVYAECIVTGVAGIEEIFADTDIFDIYDFNGILIKNNCDRESLKLLTPGLYIIRFGKAMKKLIIR